MSKLSWQHKTFNNFEWKQLLIRGIAPLESSHKSGPNTFHKNVLSSLESAIQNLSTKVYGNKKNHSFPDVHAPKFSHAPAPSLSCVYPLLHEMARRKQRSASF